MFKLISTAKEISYGEYMDLTEHMRPLASETKTETNFSGVHGELETYPNGMVTVRTAGTDRSNGSRWFKFYLVTPGS